jgi:hypothetical protein
MSGEKVELEFGELDAEGYYTAKAVAGYELGESSWADLILRAYFRPDESENREAVEAWKDSH